LSESSRNHFSCQAFTRVGKRVTSRLPPGSPFEPTSTKQGAVALVDRVLVAETYVKVARIWQYVHRLVDQHRQVINVYVSKRRDIASARTFFTTMLQAHGRQEDVATDLAAPLLDVAGRCG
jgi:transposase-like protein|tara:strand:+ start:744 stop:1106 length:363 start_codon:yes stop_codon:yes gene_type:complete